MLVRSSPCLIPLIPTLVTPHITVNLKITHRKQPWAHIYLRGIGRTPRCFPSPTGRRQGLTHIKCPNSVLKLALWLRHVFPVTAFQAKADTTKADWSLMKSKTMMHNFFKHKTTFQGKHLYGNGKTSQTSVLRAWIASYGLVLLAFMHPTQNAWDVRFALMHTTWSPGARPIRDSWFGWRDTGIVWWNKYRVLRKIQFASGKW